MHIVGLFIIVSIVVIAVVIIFGLLLGEIIPEEETIINCSKNKEEV